jgi:hypothetical protein
MWYIEVRPCDVLAFYHEIIFKKCYSINHRDEMDQPIEQLTVVGNHCDLGLVTMHQSKHGDVARFRALPRSRLHDSFIG